MFVGFRPTFNIKDVTTGLNGLVTGGNTNQWRDWHRLTRLVNASYKPKHFTEMPGSGTGGAAALASLAGARRVMSNSIDADHYYIPVSPVDTLSLISHGMTLIDVYTDSFYNQYTPWKFGKDVLNTPDDPGALLINLCLFPGKYQPSGHLNISRARETFINYTSTYISTSTPVDMIVNAVAINFLLISQGSAILRYTT
jgi:hypothetical protein